MGVSTNKPLELLFNCFCFLGFWNFRFFFINPETRFGSDFKFVVYFLDTMSTLLHSGRTHWKWVGNLWKQSFLSTKGVLFVVDRSKNKNADIVAHYEDWINSRSEQITTQNLFKMMVSQRPRRTREVTGPTPHSVAIVSIPNRSCLSFYFFLT